MRYLSIDIETYSSVDIRKAGLYKYVQSFDFAILLFAYSIDGEPVQIIDLAQGEEIPLDVVKALGDSNVIKIAYNAAFEQYCLSKYYTTPIEQWQCTMVQGMYCGYPAGLADIGEALGLSEDESKLSTGKSLIRYFCSPCKPTKSNGGRTRNLPHHAPDKWNLFKAYCKQDVVTEMEVRRRLPYQLTPFEKTIWIIDQYINTMGVKVDTDFIQSALSIDDEIKNELTTRARDITNLDNPNSVAKLKQWVEERTGCAIASLNKADLQQFIDTCKDSTVTTMLKLRQELGKTSVAKYRTMDLAVCSDDRVRGLLQYYGANRTGRWAGRMVQVHNLPRNSIETLDTARKFVKTRNIEGLKLLYGNIPDTMSQLIRTTFIPAEGCHFLVADFSAIEARVIAWLAREQWRLDVFSTHGKIYEASASAMFGVPIERIAKGNPEYALRAKGKVAELALGYQGSAGALISMGALKMGLSEDELPEIVQRWRDANPCIVNLWYTLDRIAKRCVEYGESGGLPCGVTISRDETSMMVTLPSGRQLYYINPKVVLGNDGRKTLWYYGSSQSTRKWEAISTYGGKLTENIVQAIARDCLAYSIYNLFHTGFKIVMHIHDEVVIEAPIGDSIHTLDNAINIMCETAPWAKGLPLNADGFVTNYYKKD